MKVFQREQRSLFGEILDWMLTPLLLLWPVSLALTWVVAQSIAGKPFDRALEYNVQALAQLVSVQQQRVAFNLPQPAHELLRADDSDLVYYQVLGARGELQRFGSVRVVLVHPGCHALRIQHFLGVFFSLEHFLVGVFRVGGVDTGNRIVEAVGYGRHGVSLNKVKVRPVMVYRALIFVNK